MNKKDLMIQRRKNWHQYHIPGCSNLHKRKINAIFLSPANTWEHEQMKCKICYDLLKEGKQFITEAVECATNLRRDVVCLDDGEVFEAETNLRRAKRHDPEKINVVMVENVKKKK